MAKNFNDFSKEELIIYLNELRRQLNNEKFGLYFDRKIYPEDVSEFSKLNIPLLTRDTNLDILNGSAENLLIEGDNLHALISLNMIATQDGIVDVIYIDPPYNTGAKDWKYNNNYVDGEDGYRHTKWLVMMESRLRLAKELLTPDGIIIVAIDHYELFHLGMLMDQIFGEENRIGIVSVVHKPEGRNQEKFFGTSNEFALFYAKNKDLAKFQRVALSPEVLKTFTEKDEVGLYRLNTYINKNHGQAGVDTSSRENRPDFWYPIYISKDLKEFSLNPIDDGYEAYPILDNGRERTWRTRKETFLERASNNLIVAQKNGEKVDIFEKYYENEVIKTHWIDKKYHATFSGTRLLNDILGKPMFNFPKSLYLIEDILKLTTSKDSTILDFFAGSGTTGHAVMNLNQNDGGKRRFILCTNNEGNIMSDICYPRIRTVFTGKRPDGSTYSEPHSANLRYTRIDFINDGYSRDQTKYNLVEKCDTLLCFVESTFTNIISENKFNIYGNEGNKKVTAIFNDYFDNANFDKMIKEIKQTGAKTKVIYYFSLDNNVDEALEKKVLNTLKNVEVKPIPSKIYEVYKKIADDLRRDY